MLVYRNRREDILLDECRTLIIPANCRGVMGRGLSYRTARMYEDDYRAYQKACHENALRPGGIFVYENQKKRIVHLAVQEDWRDRPGLSSFSLALSSFHKAFPIEDCAVASDMCYSGPAWKDVNRILQYTFREDERNCFVYPPLLDAQGMSRLKITGEGLCLLRYKTMLKKFSSVRLQMMCFFVNVYLKKDHYLFLKGKDGPVSLMVKREAQRIRSDMQAFHVHDASTAEELFERVLCSRDTDRLMHMCETAGKKAAAFVNGIEEDLVLAGCGLAMYLLKQGCSSDFSGMVLKMRGWSADSPFALCESRVYKRIFEELKRAHLIETDMFGYIQLAK